jgi:hypothetical protein
MSESTKRETADAQEVDGSQGRPPTEGKWVAEPREPGGGKDQGDGINRLIANDPADSVNKKNLEKGPDEDALEEKIVESGVEDSKIRSEREYELNGGQSI